MNAINLKQYGLEVPRDVATFEVIELQTMSLNDAVLRLPKTDISYLLHSSARWMDIDCNVGPQGTVFRFFNAQDQCVGNVFKPPLNKQDITDLTFETRRRIL